MKKVQNEVKPNNPALRVGAVGASAAPEDEPYFCDYDPDDECEEDCPQCGRHYDEIDHEYQSCSKCGWDESNRKWTEAREPSDDDYLNGDADILTGRWY